MMQMMQPSQQPMEMPMMVPYYAPNQQPGYFGQVGAGNNKLNISVNSTCCLIPTHNYALVASILLKRITTNAATIKRWAILDSGATSHFLPPMHPPSTYYQQLHPSLPTSPTVTRCSQCTHAPLTYRISLPPPKQPTSFPAWRHTPSSPSSQCATPDAW
jgi:hypothetical protein